MAAYSDIVLSLVGRSTSLFDEDVADHEHEIRELVSGARFLLIGGAGTVGTAITKELFARFPRALHVVDINENALAELVRDVRCSLGYSEGDFQAFCVDVQDTEFEALCRALGPYDYVLYLPALKHVRSEKDAYTLMRLLRVNILDLIHAFDVTNSMGPYRKFFAASTDKASHPINAMGASKRAMEVWTNGRAAGTPISKVRLANVAFSNGSLPAAFCERVRKRQPIAAPADVRRYFITDTEAGQLGLMSTLFGDHGDIYFPKRENHLEATSLAKLAEGYLESIGYRAVPCDSEEEARASVESLSAAGQWPCYFPGTDTSGEKIEEEFVAPSDAVDLDRYKAIGVIRSHGAIDQIREDDGRCRVDRLVREISELQRRCVWRKEDILDILADAVPEFEHHETGKNLDQKM